MFRTIVTLLDGSPLVERSLTYAQTIAQATGATLHLAYPQESERPAATWHSAVQATIAQHETHYLRQLAEQLRGSGFAVETSRPQGQSAAAIVADLAIPANALVIMTLPLHSGLREWVQIAEVMLAELAAPILLIPAWGTPVSPPGLDSQPRFLVPVDGSPQSEAALPLAASLATQLGGDLVLMHLLGQRLSATRGTLPWSGPLLGPDWRDDTPSRFYLERLRQQLQPHLANVECAQRTGWPAETIVAAGREYCAALAVLAWSAPVGRPELGTLLRGVLRRGSLPVLVVRSEATPAALASSNVTYATAGQALALA